MVPFLSAVHLDEKVYNEAKNFNPWRWMEPENEVNPHNILVNTVYNFVLLFKFFFLIVMFSIMKEKRNWRSSPFYAPFGGGARFCPGAELARLQIALFLHYFVTNYR